MCHCVCLCVCIRVCVRVTGFVRQVGRNAEEKRLQNVSEYHMHPHIHGHISLSMYTCFMLACVSTCLYMRSVCLFIKYDI